MESASPGELVKTQRLASTATTSRVSDLRKGIKDLYFLTGSQLMDASGLRVTARAPLFLSFRCVDTVKKRFEWKDSVLTDTFASFWKTRVIHHPELGGKFYPQSCSFVLITISKGLKMHFVSGRLSPELGPSVTVRSLQVKSGL